MTRLYRVKDEELLECYYCDRKGNIYTRRFSDIPRKLKPQNIGNKRYTVLHLVDKKGKSVWRLTHRLIAQTFCDNPDNKPEVDHINRNSKDNRPENLRWVTRMENAQNTTPHLRKMARLTMAQ